MKRFIALILLVAWSVVQADPPKLILQLVVDQLRGDLLHHYQSRFSSDGFNYLFDHGYHFSNAHHPHANTITCVGHATIATGTYPALHGMIANEWFNPDTEQDTYCVADTASSILPTDHTKKTLSGRSAHNLVASTLSDEIVVSATGKAFALSFKDRGAITLGGHAGKAFWFDRVNGGFITSHYYYAHYPQWVVQWNEQYIPKSEIWVLSQAQDQYLNAQLPRRSHRFPDYGFTFPHPTHEPSNPLYFKYLGMSPEADRLTADFALALIKNEQLGKTEGKTDYLAISFSATDAIGHQFGPNSLEAEDNLIRLDKTLALFLKQLDQQVGLENVLIVLTADHGVANTPAILKEHHLSTPSINLDKLNQFIIDELKQNFQLPESTLKAIELPFIYLDHQQITKQGLTLNKISKYLADRLSAQAGIFKAYPLPLTQGGTDWLSRKVARMNFSGRSGDVYIVVYPFQTLHSEDAKINHGSPWTYDTYVPLVFANPQFKAQTIVRKVSTMDIAATIAAILLITPPSACIGSPLVEVTEKYRKDSPK